MFDSNKIQMCRCLTGFRGASCEIGEHAQSVCHNPLTLKKTKIFFYKPWRPKNFYNFKLL